MKMPELLSTEYDKLGNQIEFFKVEKLSMSPVYTYFLRQMADLIDQGYGYPTTSWEDSKCSAIYAQHNNTIVGVIVYSPMEKQKMLWVVFGGVSVEYRKTGIYRNLRTLFEEQAKEQGCWGVSSYVHKNNKAALSMSEAMGSKPIFYYMVKKFS